MAYAEIDRLNKVIKIIYPTNKSVDKIKAWEEELNNYPVEIVPQNTITKEQMGLCYVLFKQFGDELGYTVGEAKELLKEAFCFEYDIGEFSLSPNKKNTLTLEQGTEFIQFIIEYAIEQDINLYVLDPVKRIKRHIKDIVPDIRRYVIACLRQRICCVCGEKHDISEGKIVDLEHYDNVNRLGGYEFDDGLQTRFLPLCRKHHIEIHSNSKKEFIKKYHLEPVYLTERLVYELLPIYRNHFKLFRKRLKEGYYKEMEMSSNGG